LQIDRLDQTTWDSYIEAFLRTIHPSKGDLRKSGTPKEDNRRWREIKADFSKILEQPDNLFGRNFERLVERAFKQGGFSLTSSPGPDFGADFAIASPKLIEALNLPILIEVKNNLRNKLAQASVDRLSALLREGRGGAGLIVIAQPSDSGTHLKFIHPIVIVPVIELFDWLQQGSFEEKFLEVVNSYWTSEQ
jgi:hypothetical protein